MGMLDMFSKDRKLSENEEALNAARRDLEVAVASVEAIATEEAAALESQSSYSSWREQRDAAASEIDRLGRLIASLEERVSSQRAADSSDALLKRAAAARVANVALAERIRTDGAQLSAQLLGLVKEAAASRVEADAINALLPDGVPRVVEANWLARRQMAQQRQIIDEKLEFLWVYQTTGELVGDQAGVVPQGGNSGFYRDDSGFSQDCVQRQFKTTSFYPAAANADYAEPLHLALRLPHFDRPGVAFSGEGRTHEHVARSGLLRTPVQNHNTRQPHVERVPV